MFSKSAGSRKPVKCGILIFLVLVASVCDWFGPGETSAPLTRVNSFAGLDREFAEPFGIAVRDGITYVSDGDAGKILKVDAGGTVSLLADGLHTPSAITLTGDGGLIVADTGDNTIKRIDGAGKVSVIAGMSGQRGDADGEALSATFNGPIGVAVGASGRIIVADTYNDRIRIIENGRVSTVAGGLRGFQEGVGATARFDTPTAVAELPNGNIVVCDSQNARIRLIDRSGITATLAGTDEQLATDGTLASAGFEEPLSVAVTDNGDVFVADGDAIRVIRNGAFPYVKTIAGQRRGYADGDFRGTRFNRPSGLAYDAIRGLFVADSDNQVIRVVGDGSLGYEASDADRAKLRYTADEFKTLQPARWPYEPPAAAREIAGTLGEIRGAIGPRENHFHNGLDIAGGYGETARFVRSEKVLLPLAAENFGTSRELIRLPTLGYIHIRLGRDASDKIFDDGRFQFERDDAGRLADVRVPRGSRFTAGDAVGTLNAMNHVHLVAGRSGAEINAIAALELPGISDRIAPVIEEVSLQSADWRKNETRGPSNRIQIASGTRVVVRAYDRMDGNAERRRLGVYKLGYSLTKAGGQPPATVEWNIRFDRMPPPDAVGFVYAPGSRSGATGETVFNYIATNVVNGGEYREGFIDPSALDNGLYALEVAVADFFGNTATRTIEIEVSK